MNDVLSAPLAARLAAYSAAAGFVLAAPPAEAQVAYHDFDPDIGLVFFNRYNLDIDEDGTDDFQLASCAYACSFDERPNLALATCNRRMIMRVPDSFPVQNGILGYDASLDPRPGIGAASRLSTGAAIGPPGTGQGFYRYAFLANYRGCSTNMNGYAFNNEEGYAGFRFVGGDGELHYGWVRLSITNGVMNLTLYSKAYELQPDTPIEAGADPAAALVGTVNQTVFPPTGGTLVYTTTVTNNTAAPLPLDLWVEAHRAGIRVLTRQLASGTLPPGVTVMRAFRIGVPAGTLGGTYDVTFNLGASDTGQRLNYQAYTIQKAFTAAEAHDAERAGLQFEVAQLEGDAFAPVGVAALPPLTHALGAPAPNPTTGRTALTLEVAEAQAVRVEVLDALGRRVALLHDGPMAAGAPHRLVFDGAALPAGVYAVRAVGATFSDVRTLTLTR